MNSMNSKTHTMHFTLVELLVVISIISILMTILLPALRKAKDKANIVFCKSNLKQLASGVNIYSVDYDGRVPDFLATGGADPDNRVNAVYDYYINRKDGFLGLGKLYAIGNGSYNTKANTYINDKNIFYCPNGKNFPQYWWGKNSDNIVTNYCMINAYKTQKMIDGYSVPESEMGAFASGNGRIAKFGSTPLCWDFLSDSLSIDSNTPPNFVKYAAHASSSNNFTFNVSYADGHAESKPTSYNDLMQENYAIQYVIKNWNHN